MLFTPKGHAFQDEVANGLAEEMWNGMSDAAIAQRGLGIPKVNGSGQVVDEVPLNSAMMLRGSWNLGQPRFAKWAEGGFSVEALEALDPTGSVKAANCGNCSYEKWRSQIFNAMADFGNTDISCLTGLSDEGQYVECSPEIGSFLSAAGKQKVEDTVVAAQDQTLGISQAEKSFDMMSCVDFAFQGSFDQLFQVPNFDSIAGILKQGIGFDQSTAGYGAKW